MLTTVRDRPTLELGALLPNKSVLSAPWLAALSIVIFVGCWSPAASPSAPGAQPSTMAARTRTLTMAIRVEPDSIAAKGPRQVGVSLHATKRLFNAELDIQNEVGDPVPYLADAVPQLNTDAWRVESDGR